MNRFLPNKSFLVSVIFLCVAAKSMAQNDNPYGEIPYVKNFGINDYTAQAQNWDALQSPNGFIYFANNMGVLEFDGVNWNKIYLPEKKKPRSIAISKTGKLYVGGANDFGYIAPDSLGANAYISLSNDLKTGFGDVWYTFVEEEVPYFFTENKIYFLKNETLQNLDYPLDNLLLKSVLNIRNGFFISFVDQENKDKKYLFYFDIQEQTFKKINYKRKIEPKAIFMHKPNYYLVFNADGTINTCSVNSSKEFVFNDIEKEVFNIPEGKVTAVTKSLMMYAVCIAKKGVWLFDKNGNFIRKITTKNGLENLVINDCFFDRDNNLWLSNDYGISKIDFSSSITFFDKQSGISSASEDIIYQDGEILLGTRSGIYIAKLKDESIFFKQTDIFNSECFDLHQTNNGDFLVVGNDGIYQLNPTTKEKSIISYVYAWKFINDQKDSNLVYVGLDGGGLGRLSKNYSNNKWEYSAIQNTTGNVRSLIEFGEDLFYGVSNFGVIKMDTSKNQNQNRLYGIDTTKSQTDFYLEDFQEQLFVGTAHGLFLLNENKDSLLPFNEIDSSFIGDELLIHRLYNENNQRLWVVLFRNSGTEFEEEELGYLEKNNNGEWTWSYSQFEFVSKDIINAFVNDNNGNIWMAGGSGVYIYNTKNNNDVEKGFPAYISKVRLRDSTFFNYTFNYNGNIPELEYNQSFIRFEVVSPTFYANINNEFRFKLEGYSDKWTDWSTNNWIEFSKLGEGNYKFVAQSRNAYGVQSETVEFSFRVLPPWYRTWWAYITYFIVSALLMYLIIKLSIRRIKNQNIRLEEIVQERTAEIANKNDELEGQKAEIEEKNNDIMSSIKYAERLQKAILPSREKIGHVFPNHFVLFKPKDIVSGDFYWLQTKTPHTFFSAVDCTGHGVPGSIVSIVGNNGLNRCVNEFQLKDPGKILDQLSEIVTESFNAQNAEVKDGMDMALSVYNQDLQELSFSGANNPLILIRKGKEVPEGLEEDVYSIIYNEDKDITLFEIKADKQPIGSFDNRKPFKTHTLKLKKGDTIYMYSDGYIDQFGGELEGSRKLGGKKFKSKPFKKLLITIQDQSMDQQKKILNETIEKWRGDLEQIDDICVFGVRI